jgi:hypothetical protein
MLEAEEDTILLTHNEVVIMKSNGAKKDKDLNNGIKGVWNFVITFTDDDGKYVKSKRHVTLTKKPFDENQNIYSADITDDDNETKTLNSEKFTGDEDIKILNDMLKKIKDAELNFEETV